MKRWSRWKIALMAGFVIWSVFGLTFLLAHIDERTIAAAPLPAGLRAFIGGCLHEGDIVLILLAFANTYLHAAEQWPLRHARRWAFVVLAVALGTEIIGVHTGLIFGRYAYTGAFGPGIATVPLMIPLAWYVVVTNALFLVRAAGWPRSRAAQAALTAGLCTLYDFALEPFATDVRHYWIWQGNVIPASNYLAWFLLSGLLVLIFAPRSSTREEVLSPALIFGLTLVIFLVGS